MNEKDQGDAARSAATTSGRYVDDVVAPLRGASAVRRPVRELSYPVSHLRSGRGALFTTPVLAFAALFAILQIAVTGATAEDLQLFVEANRNQIYLGEPVVLTVRVAGADQGVDPDLSAISKAGVRLLGSHSDSRVSVVVVNGRMTREAFTGRTFAYEIVPAETGKFKAGPIEMKAGGRTLRSDGPVIEVLGIEKQDDVILEIAPSRDSLLPDESFQVRFTVLLRIPDGASVDPILPAEPPQLLVPFLEQAIADGLEGQDMREVLGQRVTGDPRRPGFLINNYTIQPDPFDFGSMFEMDLREKPAKFLLDRREVVRNGRRYYEYGIQLTYTARQEGTFTFGPAQFKGKLVTKVEAGADVGVRPVFAVGPARVVRVIPPPEEGRPASYIGVFGSNLTVEASLDSQTCNVGDPLQFTLALKGHVNFANAFPPALGEIPAFSSSFRVYDDTVSSKQSGQSRTYRYTIRPTTVGTLEVPSIEIAYFDSVGRAYRTIRTQPIPVHVRASVAMADSMIVSAATNRLSITTASEDVIVTAPVTMVPAGASPGALFPGPWVLALLCSGPVAYGLVAGGSFLCRIAPGAKRRRRRQQAAGIATAALRHIESQIAGDPAGAASTIYEVIAEFIAARCDLASTSLTPSDLGHRLAAAGIASGDDTGFMKAAERCFNVAFSGTSAEPEQVSQDCRTIGDCLARVDVETGVEAA